MKQGALVYNNQLERFDIRFDLDEYYGGLHCGECLDVYSNGKWVPTRIEFLEGWYLVGIHTDGLDGLRVQI